MNKEYETLICCDDFMRFVNMNSQMVPKFVFHCKTCGKIKVCYDTDLDVFEKEGEQ